MIANHNFRIASQLDLQLEKTMKESDDVFEAVTRLNGFVFKDLRSDKRPVQGGLFHLFGYRIMDPTPIRHCFRRSFHFAPSTLFREKCYRVLQTLQTIFPQLSTNSALYAKVLVPAALVTVTGCQIRL